MQKITLDVSVNSTKYFLVFILARSEEFLCDNYVALLSLKVLLLLLYKFRISVS